MPLIIFQALHGLPIKIFGDGDQPVDLIYIDDLAKVTVAYTELDSVPSKTLDTGLTFRMTVNDMVELIRKIVKSESDIYHISMRLGEDDKKYVELLSTEPAANLANIADAIDIKVGMEKTVKYYLGLSSRVQQSVLKFYYGDVPKKGDKTARTILANRSPF